MGILSAFCVLTVAGVTNAFKDAGRPLAAGGKEEGPTTPVGPQNDCTFRVVTQWYVTAFSASTIPFPKKLLYPVLPWQVAVVKVKPGPCITVLGVGQGWLLAVT